MQYLHYVPPPQDAALVGEAFATDRWSITSKFDESCQAGSSDGDRSWGGAAVRLRYSLEAATAQRVMADGRGGRAQRRGEHDDP
jgi:hypothetical protein